MMALNPTYKPLGKRAILIEWPAGISPEFLKNLLVYKKTLGEFYAKVNVEIINTYNSITIFYHGDIENIYNEISRLKALSLPKNSGGKIERKRWVLPVCYDLKFGVDLTAFAAEKKCSISDIINLHTAAVYTVYFFGFRPGFMYLGGLHSDLEMGRKAQPRLRVEQGAVGIAGAQTGVYPATSPGGWQIIGNCPISLFNAHREPPCFIQAGDEVRFESISKEAHQQLLKNACLPKYQRL